MPDISMAEIAEAGGNQIVMKVRDIIAMIEDDRWYIIATRGSHRQY